MRRVVASLVVIVILATGCSDNVAEQTQAPTSAEPSGSADPSGSIPPTEAALAASEVFRVVPAGYDDCGATVLTSGWPTTTVFNAEVAAECIIDASNSGAPAQYAYWGRDGGGGILGTIVRVEAAGEITFVDFTIDAAGNTDGSETSCRQLATAVFEPPTCAAG